MKRVALLVLLLVLLLVGPALVGGVMAFVLMSATEASTDGSAQAVVSVLALFGVLVLALWLYFMDEGFRSWLRAKRSTDQPAGDDQPAEDAKSREFWRWLDKRRAVLDAWAVFVLAFAAVVVAAAVTFDPSAGLGLSADGAAMALYAAADTLPMIDVTGSLGWRPPIESLSSEAVAFRVTILAVRGVVAYAGLAALGLAWVYWKERLVRKAARSITADEGRHTERIRSHADDGSPTTVGTKAS